MPRINRNLLFLILWLSPIVATALSSDANKLAKFKSESATYNYKQHIATFIGDVVMTQGTTKLTANKVIVYRTAAGKIKKLLAYGKLAHYQTLPDSDKRLLHAKAKTIEYFPEKGLAILIGDAHVHQGKNSVIGTRIVYNMKKQMMTSTPGTKARTVIVLNPANPPKASDMSEPKS